MDVKTKIALNSLAQKLSRGIISEEKAAAEFTKITGYGPDDEPAEGDQDAEDLGKFMEALAAKYPMPQKTDSESESEESEGPTVQLPEQTPVRTRKGKAPKEE